MMRWHSSPFGAPVTPGGAGIPLAPVGDPVAYAKWLLEFQQPTGGPGVVLAANYHWQLNSFTDLVVGEVLTPAGTVPRTEWTGGSAVAPESSANIQSPLVTGYSSFDGVTDSLVAATSGVQDITGSALIVWCARYPTTPGGTMGAVNKREAGGSNTGYESGINLAGQAITTLDYGAASVVLPLLENYTAEVVAGVWHWFAFLIDSANSQCMFASESEIGAWVAIPGGSLSSTTLFSLGAGRLQSVPMDLLCEMSFLGPQVDGLFGSPTEAESASNDPSLPNIMSNVCGPLALDTTLTLSVDPVP